MPTSFHNKQSLSQIRFNSVTKRATPCIVLQQFIPWIKPPAPPLFAPLPGQVILPQCPTFPEQDTVTYPDPMHTEGHDAAVIVDAHSKEDNI